MSDKIISEHNSGVEVQLENSEINVVNNIYSLRSNFLVVALTGRTGSGCTTVAHLLAKSNFRDLKSNYQAFRNKPIDNQARKDRIVYNFIEKNWQNFTLITASDIIYYFAFQLPFDEFVEEMAKAKGAKNSIDPESIEIIKEILSVYSEEYVEVSNKILQVKEAIESKSYRESKEVELRELQDIICKSLPEFRHKIENALVEEDRNLVPSILQNWGNNIRTYKSIKQDVKCYDAPEAIASVINSVIKIIRTINKNDNKPTRIVIDALRNPFEILYFRERYSSFYCMSVNTNRDIRHDKLLKDRKLNIAEINRIDENEKEKKELRDIFSMIDIDKCIQLSDIHLSHDGTPINRNFDLVNQIFTYVALMLHPGLVPPTPLERLMQIAYTAKLNSGCLSRQVGAAITDSEYSLKSIGWNSVPTGQVPCSLRQLDDLINHEDEEAFSDHELRNVDFKAHIDKLKDAYTDEKRTNLHGLHLTYCFKNIHTTIFDNQKYNQVHTRSLHAEENAFLQIAKYGGIGLKGGILFSTASCCELCAKKAYQLGIRKIYYIDSYPGITAEHVLKSGRPECRPEAILFHGAVGRAYMNLYNQFLPLKDEIEYLTEVDVKCPDKSPKKN